MKSGGTFDTLKYQMGLLDVNNNKHVEQTSKWNISSIV